MSFTPITTQADLDDIIKRRLERLRGKQAQETSDLQAQLIQAQQMLINQAGLIDLIRQAIQEEMSILAGGKHE